MRLLRPFTALPRSSVSFLLTGLDHAAHTFAESCGRTVHALAVGILPALFLLRSTREEVYNVLWALVFAFATLNILSLGAQRFEANRRGLTFGEVLAILVVVVSVIMLGWEMLNLFKIFPIRLAPR
jgi:hypothetical protein